MPNVSLVSALAGVSSLFGLFSLLAYFFIGNKDQRTDSVVDVMGHRVNLELEIQLISQFKTDAAKLKALTQRHAYNDTVARAILKKISGGVDVHHAAKSRDRRYLVAAFVFAFMASLAVISPIFQRTPGVFSLSKDKKPLVTSPVATSSGVSPDAANTAPAKTTAVVASAISADVATPVTKNPIPVAAGATIANAKANGIPLPQAVAVEKSADEAKAKQAAEAKRVAKESAFRKRFQWAGKFYKGYVLVLDGEKFRILSIDGNECEIGDVGYFRDNGNWFYKCKLNNVAYEDTREKQ